jgi:ABC-type proline/glycine betaine transport system permease subunit
VTALFVAAVLVAFAVGLVIGVAMVKSSDQRERVHREAFSEYLRTRKQ